MKKVRVFAVAASAAILTACGTLGQSSTGSASTGILGSVLNDVLTGGTITNVITSVIGA